MKCRGAWLLGVVLIAGAVQAEVLGPPAPVPSKTTPAQQAIALSHQRNDPPPPQKPCRQPRGQDEITVCGNPGDRSPYRLPLPDERPEARHPGEPRSVDIGTGPVPVVPGTTVARFGMSAAAKEHGATLKLIEEQERAKAEAIERAKRIQTEMAPDGTIRTRTDGNDETQPK